MEKLFRFRHVNELTGLFVLAVLGLVVAGIVLSGHSQRWFSRKYEFDVLLPAQGASGLSRGSGVFILGVPVGSVDDIEVGEDGRMKARVRIRGDFERFVRADSTATIKRVFGVAGDAFLEVSGGIGVQLPAKEGAIRCETATELSVMLEKTLTELTAELMPVVKKAGPVLDAWTKLGLDLQEGSVNLDRLILRFDRVVTRVEQGEGTVGKLLTDTALVDDARKALLQANESMVTLRVIMKNAESVMENAESVMKNTDSVVKNADAVVKSAQSVVNNVDEGTARLPEISGAIASEMRDLPGLVIQTQKTLREMERLVEGLQLHWLVRKYIEPETSGGRISSVEVPGGHP